MRCQITALQKRMLSEGIDAVLIPTSDPYGSEFIHEHDQIRRFFSGFTGDAGTLLVTRDEAALWTDGRFFLQGEQQLAGSGICLMKDGCPGTPSLPSWLKQKLPRHGLLALDGSRITAAFGKKLEKTLAGKDASIRCDFDPAEGIWTDRPGITPAKIWDYSVAFAGSARGKKLGLIRREMKKAGADALLLTALDDIAWLFNLRGSDIPYNPFFFGTALVLPEEAVLFALPGSISPALKKRLAADGVRTEAPDRAETALTDLPEDLALMYDPSQISYRLYRIVSARRRHIERPCPVREKKAVKNRAEIRCTTEAHRRDGAAMVRFLYWLKTNIGKKEITEISAAETLAAFRRRQKGFLDLSFPTIAGFGPHGAVIHYNAGEESNAVLRPEGFLLVDSGAHYLDGTTDITRTIALGPLTDEMKANYTRVLKGCLALAAARFPEGARGETLDVLARRALWEEGLDFRHGTGHGVGHVLCVHEGPNRIRWQTEPALLSAKLAPGMITTDEPGYYRDGEYGIRLENELLCVPFRKTEYGRFFAFRVLTLCPFDRDAVNPGMLSADELCMLNEYHARVLRELSPLLPAKERRWLTEATAAIVR